MGAIRVNQMGYKPDSYKQVLFVGTETEFHVYEENNHQLVFSGKLSKPYLDDNSKDIICIGDFSELQKPGNYVIRVGREESYQFTISAKQYELCTDALLKAFYYQRCGVELTEEFAGPWRHTACHLQPSYVFQQDAEQYLSEKAGYLEQIDTSGGWHDAGDYGRYTIAAAKAVADLLLAYEHFGKAFEHMIHIPESKNDGADLLHEVKFELDFLLKLQRDIDGSVYTKVATRYFPGMVMPEEDTKPLFIFDISSPATASFCAIMAMAARVYQGFDKTFANTCLDAAKKAYTWLKQNPKPLLFHNPTLITSGEYGDNCDLDERYFAAAEMYCTTGEEEYHKDFLMIYKLLGDKSSLGWRNVGGYGSIAYLFSKQSVRNEVYEELKNNWLKQAYELVDRSMNDGYGITLSLDEYKWGSNMILLNQCMQLIIANSLKKSSEYDAVIQNNWDYLFGKNPMDISYVTGLGEKAVMEPHHRPSAGDQVKAPVPGLVSGGPCAALIDEIAKEKCQGLPPAKCFVDHTKSYSTNEIAIYWNSPAVYVGAYLCMK